MEEYHIDGMRCIVCKLDGSRFYSMHDFKGHLMSPYHRKHWEEQKAKPKKRVNPREKIFNYT